MSTPQQQLIPYIHHERQEEGSMLCAQHALNCLLQGQYYDASQLAQIANELDHLEASELGLSMADISARDETSLNLDDTGFFSVSVIEKALQVWGVGLTNWRSSRMRSRHEHPEDEMAFILNLDSHWFTIRSFGTRSKIWYNLNSFLKEPSWIGNNYLATLLNTAETEGYSVFVVHPLQGTIGDSLKVSDADQIADQLPPLNGSSSSSSSSISSYTNLSNTNLGLRPKKDKNQTFTVTNDLDNEEELQAAISASLVQISQPNQIDRSRVRQTRSGSGGDSVDGEDNQSGMRQLDETDADIDAIAPSRRRHRADDTNSLRSSASRMDTLDEDLRRAMEASLTSSSRSNADSSSRRRIEISASSSNRPLGRRKGRDDQRRTGLTAHDAIELDDSREEFIESQPVSLLHGSSFLSSVIPTTIRNHMQEIIDDDDDDDNAIYTFSVPEALEASAVIGPRQDRQYDDEDAQLQAALAASLGDTEAASRFGADSAAFSYVSEEEKQPMPADVDRIFKMRQEAKKKAQEEQIREKRRARGEDNEIDLPQARSSSKEVNGSIQTSTAEPNDDQSEEEQEKISAEEMRRRRLARFG